MNTRTQLLLSRTNISVCCMILYPWGSVENKRNESSMWNFYATALQQLLHIKYIFTIWCTTIQQFAFQVTSYYDLLVKSVLLPKMLLNHLFQLVKVVDSMVNLFPRWRLICSNYQNHSSVILFSSNVTFFYDWCQIWH